MVPSGNDAAVLIAENTSGTEGKFVALMNAKAEELGMASTHFADASGLTAEDHYTTASDYLTIVAYAMRIPLFREIVATQYKEIEVGDRTLELVTTDKLFEVLETGEALGVKTGFVDEAGYCFAGAARKDGVELYAMIINAPDDMQRFYDAAALLEWGFRHYRPVELLNSSQQVATVALTSWMDKTVDVYIPAAVRVELLDLNGDIRQDVEAYGVEGSVARGQVLGRIVWQHGGETIATSDLVAAESVAEPGFWEGVQIWWSRFFGGFSGEPAHAEGKVLLPASVPVPPAP
jgi:D-alanyl-D-alanine carboxypeptidase (penicillin-binding protein 5/6)